MGRGVVNKEKKMGFAPTGNFLYKEINSYDHHFIEDKAKVTRWCCANDATIAEGCIMTFWRP